MSDFGYIKRNFQELSGEIAELGKTYGSPEVRLVSVTKSATDDEVLALVGCGALDIGENRPQMLMARAQLLDGAGLSARLHEIGTLQRNKVRLIGSRTELIHSLDSIQLARQIDRVGAELMRKIPVLIEVNSARESAKGGVIPEDVEALYNELLGLEYLIPTGLMTMGPPVSAEEIRPYFRLTKKLFDNINERYGWQGGGVLSMGMSDSYRTAIEEGSTLVRVGRRLFLK
ncbi:MAG: YggS family pyridoxal phosphate-dependent enzyme [Clostridia bacterium]|nr:YggS family pyridoxal phosphate-dependent enzyme [Clostridia bacterium]